MLFAVSAHLVWGIAPLYWVMISEVAALDLVAHRVLWACLLLVVAMSLMGRLGATLRQMCERK
ncbi:MAG: hypothetical protein V2J89_08420, partial [Halieaceae bacterium]|nr:hypothetical protein [Halieaceae bacterium]